LTRSPIPNTTVSYLSSHRSLTNTPSARPFHTYTAADLKKIPAGTSLTKHQKEALESKQETEQIEQRLADLRTQYRVKRVPDEDSAVEHPVDNGISKTLSGTTRMEASKHGYPSLKLVNVKKFLNSIGDAPVLHAREIATCSGAVAESSRWEGIRGNGLLRQYTPGCTIRSQVSKNITQPTYHEMSLTRSPARARSQKSSTTHTRS
jgi:hypothetical protein